MTANDLLCLNLDDQRKIAETIKSNEKCQIDLKSKETLIQERLIQFDAGHSASAWYQDPAVIVGGVVVSFSLGSLLTWYVISR